MAVVMVGDWGENEEGIYYSRVNATRKNDLQLIIDEMKKAGFKFWEKPCIEPSHKTWSVLLKFYIPGALGYPEESSN